MWCINTSEIDSDVVQGFLYKSLGYHLFLGGSFILPYLTSLSHKVDSVPVVYEYV